MAKAAELFALDVSLDSDGSFRTLLTAQYVCANDRMSKFYGLQSLLARPTGDSITIGGSGPTNAGCRGPLYNLLKYSVET